MINKKILGHSFMDYRDDSCYIAIQYYKCSICQIVICESYDMKMYNLLTKDIFTLTCNEVIIKNIIE